MTKNLFSENNIKNENYKKDHIIPNSDYDQKTTNIH